MSAVAVAEADAAVAEAERAIAAASLDESGDTRVPKGGFRVDAMSMKDGETGAVKWARSSWPAALDGAALEARVPPSVLKCREVSRELTFSTRDAIANLRLEQRVMLLDQVLETWSFSFGFVIPGSTNTWQTVIEAAGEGKMLDPEDVSGLVYIDTVFFDDDKELASFVVRIHYDGKECQS